MHLLPLACLTFLLSCSLGFTSAEVGTAALLSSAAVFFYQQRKAAAPLFLRRSSDQRSSASVKIIDLPLLQKKDFEGSVLCSHLIIKSQLKCRLAQLDINTITQMNENLTPSDSVRSQAMFHLFITTVFIVLIARHYNPDWQLLLQKDSCILPSEIKHFSNAPRWFEFSLLSFEYLESFSLTNTRTATRSGKKAKTLSVRWDNVKKSLISLCGNRLKMIYRSKITKLKLARKFWTNSEPLK